MSDKIKVKLLKRARRLVASRSAPHRICSALCVVAKTKAEHRARDDLHDLISDRLCPASTVEWWAMRQGLADKTTPDSEFVAFRLRWIDHLIKEFS